MPSNLRRSHMKGRKCSAELNTSARSIVSRKRSSVLSRSAQIPLRGKTSWRCSLKNPEACRMLLSAIWTHPETWSDARLWKLEAVLSSCSEYSLLFHAGFSEGLLVTFWWKGCIAVDGLVTGRCRQASRISSIPKKGSCSELAVPRSILRHPVRSGTHHLVRLFENKALSSWRGTGPRPPLFAEHLTRRLVCLMSRRGVWQLKNLTLRYCDWSGSSQGTRY